MNKETADTFETLLKQAFAIGQDVQQLADKARASYVALLKFAVDYESIRQPHDVHLGTQ